MSNSFKNDADEKIIDRNYDKDLARGDKAKYNSDIHKRIDEILERKRLKDLLDDSE